MRKHLHWFLFGSTIATVALITTAATLYPPTAGGGANQSPWTASENANTFILTNVGAIILGGAATIGSTNAATVTFTNAINVTPTDVSATNSTIAGITTGWQGRFTNNVIATNKFQGPQVDFTTNSGSALTPDFTKAYTLLSTNAAFTFLAPVNVDANLAQTTTTLVTNTTASVVAITCPTAGVATGQIKTNGTWNVTNLTIITWYQYGGKATNAIALPIF